MISIQRNWRHRLQGILVIAFFTRHWFLMKLSGTCSIQIVEAIGQLVPVPYLKLQKNLIQVMLSLVILMEGKEVIKN